MISLDRNSNNKPSLVLVHGISHFSNYYQVTKVKVKEIYMTHRGNTKTIGNVNIRARKLSSVELNLSGKLKCSCSFALP